MGTAANSKTRGTNNILPNKVVINMSDRITMLQPSATPLTVLTKKLATESTSNYKFEWLEDDLMARWVTFTAANEGAPGTTLTIDDSTVLAIDDLLKNPRTGEVIRVTAIVSGTSITVSRGYGETAAANINQNDKLLCIGNAIMQGDGIPAEKYNVEAAVYNFTQIFRTPFSVTNTLNATKLYTGKELARLRREKGIEHAVSMEYAFLFGERKLDLTGSQPRTTTGGVLRFLSGTQNVVSKPLASVVEADFVKFLEGFFQYGSPSKLMLCGASMLTLLDTWGKGKMQVQNGADTYGLDIYTYTSPHGTVKFVKHPLLVNGYSGYNIGLDMDMLKYRPLEGRDTGLLPNRQNNDVDGVLEEYLTEAGLEIRAPKRHGMFLLT